MKESFLDAFERHVIYFLAGFVTVISVLLVTFFLYVFIFAPMLVVGGMYLLIVPIIGLPMYFIGRRIIEDKEE